MSDSISYPADQIQASVSLTRHPAGMLCLRIWRYEPSNGYLTTGMESYATHYWTGTEWRADEAGDDFFSCDVNVPIPQATPEHVIWIRDRSNMINLPGSDDPGELYGFAHRSGRRRDRWSFLDIRNRVCDGDSLTSWLDSMAIAYEPLPVPTDQGIMFRLTDAERVLLKACLGV